MKGWMVKDLRYDYGGLLCALVTSDTERLVMIDCE